MHLWYQCLPYKQIAIGLVCPERITSKVNANNYKLLLWKEDDAVLCPPPVDDGQLLDLPGADTEVIHGARLLLQDRHHKLKFKASPSGWRQSPFTKNKPPSQSHNSRAGGNSHHICVNSGSASLEGRLVKRSWTTLKMRTTFGMCEVWIVSTLHTFQYPRTLCVLLPLPCFFGKTELYWHN